MIHVEALYTPPLTTMSLITSKERHIREPIWYLDSGCSRSMTGVKSYLHKYVEQPGPKVVFGDNSSCITEGYGSINCGGIVFTKVAFVNGLKYNLISISQLCDAKYIVQFDDKQGTIFNANKEIVLIAPRRNDVYVLDMSSLSPNGACFFAKASESVNWLWHKRLSHLNFKNINKLAKQNKVLGLPSLVYSKDKPCTTCEKGKHHRASFKTKQNFSIRKCLHLLHMDLFGPVSPMSINHEKYTLVIVDEYSRSINVKRHDKTPYEILKGRIPDIRYFHVFGCHVFIHNQKDYLGKFDAKADDRYFLGYSFISKAFRVFNTRRQQVEETYHVTFDESMEAIRFTNTSVDEIGIDDSSRYPPDEFLQEDDPSRQYQVDSDVSYYIIPHGRSLTELTQENHVPEVIAPNEPDIPHTEDTEGPPDLINTKGTHEQNVQNDQMIIQPTDIPSGNNTEVSGSITESLVPDVTQSHISNQASTSSHPVPQDRWSRDQHIELVNIIGDPGEGMLTRSMAAKLTAASASECLFADFLSEIEPKKVSEALKHPGWVDAMQEELNQFYRNKVWTLVPLPYGKIAIGSKWVFRNKNDKHEVMEFESVQSNTTAKLPILKLENGTFVIKMSVPVIAEEKTNKKNDVEVSNVSPNINTTCPQDLEQIHEDDMEAIDLKWQLSLLSMRAKRTLFRELKTRNKEGQFKYQDNTRKQGNNEDTSSKAMLAIDGVGFDWSDMAEEQCDDLKGKLNQTEFTTASYKRGLATVEEQLITYRKNEVLFSEEVAVLKRSSRPPFLKGK
ncbi:retrovirus-related pol polyprotein from transposon TNT 1-94 [Tanacetum coccineum]